MKRMALIMILAVMFGIMFGISVFYFEGIEQMIMLINSLCMVLLISSNFAEENKKKNDGLYNKVMIIQNSMIINIMTVIYLISGVGVGEGFYSDWSYMINSISLVVTILMYIDAYRRVSENDKLKEILELKGDSIIKKLYDYYYLSIGMVLVLTTYYLTKITDGNIIYLEIVFVLIMMAHILQISFLKKILKG